jgi:ribosomal protein S17E
MNLWNKIVEVENNFKTVTENMMLNKYDGNNGRILEKNVDSVMELMTQLSKELNNRMGEINELVEDTRDNRLDPIESQVRGQGHDIGNITKWVDIAENWIENIIMIKSVDPGKSRKEDEKKF